ncbi:hypothetical protein HID58_060532 [Brassica napus]|uniref:Uncharacterized protein n=1 Tax=Brassica napus TaxID=3708 RepID=A0ABQ7ZWV1_BRANA|nr:hypothetical protein HID58_060532 [Brassica napus]
MWPIASTRAPDGGLEDPKIAEQLRRSREQPVIRRDRCIRKRTPHSENASSRRRVRRSGDRGTVAKITGASPYKKRSMNKEEDTNIAWIQSVGRPFFVDNVGGMWSISVESSDCWVEYQSCQDRTNMNESLSACLFQNQNYAIPSQGNSNSSYTRQVQMLGIKDARDFYGSMAHKS